MIYHVVTQTDWLFALENGYYEAASLASEGFIHTSKKNQVKGVLERYYKNQTDLILLHIDEKKLIPELRYETASSVAELFPHIYGKLNLEAVINTSKI